MPLLARCVAMTGLMVGLAYVGARASTNLMTNKALEGSLAYGALSSKSWEPPERVAAAPIVSTPVQQPSLPDPRVRHNPGCNDAVRAVTPDGRVVLNAATARDLERLPGVGPKRAKQIIALRERLGRFRTIRDLLRIRGIGFRTIQKLTPLVLVNPPANAEANSS